MSKFSLMRKERETESLNAGNISQRGSVNLKTMHEETQEEEGRKGSKEMLTARRKAGFDPRGNCQALNF